MYWNWLKKSRSKIRKNFLRNFIRKSISWVYQTNYRCILNSKCFLSQHTHTPIILKMKIFPILLSGTPHVLFFLLRMLLFGFFFVSFSFQCIFGWQYFLWYVKVKTLNTQYFALSPSCTQHSHSHTCHTFSFLVTLRYECVCNSYSCGYATVFGIHQRIYQTKPMALHTHTYILCVFDFSATLSWCQTDEWKNLLW